MIDFHTHILPKVDDGAKSVEETFNLIKEAKNAGFDSIISTSHYIENYYEVTAAERKFWLDTISKELKKDNLDIKLYLGNEMYFSENIVDLLRAGKGCTINNSDYVLFEFPLNCKPINMYDVIYDMMSNRLIPILAHPERYTFVQENPNILMDFIEKGVLLQSNFGSILGQYGQRAQIIAQKMLQCDMVHFLGSDVHKQETVYLNIPTILNEIRNIIGKEKLNIITEENPRLVLDNKKIEINDPIEINLTLREKILMKKK